MAQTDQEWWAEHIKRQQENRRIMNTRFRELDLSNKIQFLLIHTFAILIGIAFFAAVGFFIASTMDQFAENSRMRDQCLKSATNGYDIARCR